MKNGLQYVKRGLKITEVEAISFSLFIVKIWSTVLRLVARGKTYFFKKTFMICANSIYYVLICFLHLKISIWHVNHSKYNHIVSDSLSPSSSKHEARSWLKFWLYFIHTNRVCMTHYAPNTVIGSILRVT